MSMSELSVIRKRNWQSHFSPSEINLIADEVKARQSKLSCPFSTTVTNTAKIREWDEIATKLFVRPEILSPDTEEMEVKKKAIDVRRESSKTGGSPAPVGLSDLEHKVVSMIPQCQTEGITGGLESEVDETTEIHSRTKVTHNSRKSEREAQPDVSAVLASEKERTEILKVLLEVQRKILAVSEQRLQVESYRLALEREKFEF